MTDSERRPEVRRSLYHFFFAWTLAHAAATDRRLYGERKRALFGDLAGTVLEIGAGAGVNVEYLAPGVRYVAVEPNVYFHGRIRRRARKAGLEAEVTAGVAERLPLPDASVDAVVSTLVLCSVDRQQQALAEIRRVLRPGGRFVFIEHVAAPRRTVLRGLQRLLRLPWSVMADGCRPDRETGRAIEAAGFAEVRFERFNVPLGLVRPHIGGTAVAA